MRAAWYERRGPARDVLIVGEMPQPEPSANEVLVKIVASGVNPHDAKSRSGWSDHAMPAPRVIPHADGAGIITAVGPGVDSSRIGERVWTFRADTARPGGGTAAEFAVVSASHAIPLAPEIAFSTGASIGVPAITAHASVLRDGSVSGQRVLVQGGAGAVGQYAIQFARWSGAFVLATASSPEKAEVARKCGADVVLDYRDADFVEKMMEATKGTGVDRIVEVDLGANLESDLALIKMNGTIASYSSTRVPNLNVDYYAMARRGITLHVIQGRSLREKFRSVAVRDISSMMMRGQLRHPEPAIFSLSDVAIAHEFLESASNAKKVIVDVDPSLMSK